MGGRLLERGWELVANRRASCACARPPPVIEGAVHVIGANEASWDDLQAVFGRGAAAKCQCQRIKLGDHDWFAMPVEERTHRLREETDCGHREADRTSGMVPKPGQDVTWGEMNVGSRNTFMAAGFREVSRPTTRRVVMRLDLD
jgi:hypothetical protein